MGRLVRTTISRITLTGFLGQEGPGDFKARGLSTSAVCLSRVVYIVYRHRKVCHNESLGTSGRGQARGRD
jgi:hypothetical protein